MLKNWQKIINDMPKGKSDWKINQKRYDNKFSR